MLLIAVSYRPLSASQVVFKNHFENLLVILASLNSPSLVMGDFNIDLMNLVSANQNRMDRNTVHFLEFPLAHGLNLYVLCHPG